MKTIGLIGGMSWESTVTYYKIINETVKEKSGGLHSAKLLLYSVDFAEIEEWIQRKDSPLPVFDTTLIHANRAATVAVNNRINDDCRL